MIAEHQARVRLFETRDLRVCSPAPTNNWIVHLVIQDEFKISRLRKITAWWLCFPAVDELTSQREVHFYRSSGILRPHLSSLDGCFSSSARTTRSLDSYFVLATDILARSNSVFVFVRCSSSSFLRVNGHLRWRNLGAPQDLGMPPSQMRNPAKS